MANPESIDVGDFLRSAAHEYLMPYAMAIDPAYEVNWHHEWLAERLEKALKDLMEHNISTNIIIEMPPRHGKSDLASQKFPSWALGKYPEIPIILASYSAELAEDFGLKTRDIMENDEYQAHFDTRLRADSKAKGRWQTLKRGPMDETGEYEMIPSKGGYTAAGVGGPITGRGFKIGIIDDPIKNREEAESEVMSEKLWSWYKSTFRTRQEGNAIKIVIMTRWHMRDLVGRLIEKQKEDQENGEKDYDKWEILRLPAIAEHNEAHRKEGEALWPWKFNINQLLQTKTTLGPYEFESLYQQNPIPSEKQEFKAEWLQQEFTDADVKDLQLEFMTTVDLNVGEEEKDDDGVIMTVGKALNKPDWYIWLANGDKYDPGETITEIFKHVTLFRSHVGLESVQYQKALKYFIVEKQREKEFYFNVYPLKQNQRTAKNIRIRGLIPLASAGVLHFKKGAPGMQKLKDQLLAFPQGKHDDYPDALASQLEMWSNTVKDELDQASAEKSRQIQRDSTQKISDLQGSIEPRVNEEAEKQGVLDDIDIGTMGHGKAQRRE